MESGLFFVTAELCKSEITIGGVVVDLGSLISMGTMGSWCVRGYITIFNYQRQGVCNFSINQGM